MRLRYSNERDPSRTRKTNLFSGIVRCVDCAKKLYYSAIRNFEVQQNHFICSTSEFQEKKTVPIIFIIIVLKQGDICKSEV